MGGLAAGSLVRMSLAEGLKLEKSGRAREGLGTRVRGSPALAAARGLRMEDLGYRGQRLGLGL